MRKQVLISALVGLFLTIACYSISIFIWGIDLFLLPILFLLYLFGILGVIIAPLVVYQYIKNKPTTKWQSILIGLMLGLFIGYLIQRPIWNWDEQNRNMAGDMISQSLEDFKSEHGNYPQTLSELVIDLELLPSTYPLNKFEYTSKDETYQLYIPIPIIDRWYWNRTQKKFEYQDF
ncbi:hypothetical protein [Roseivirga sp.]|uniref:hypothetical protein n=1 Tax=Roseivirga sp. TaxID=1964215 RepID=UPI003B51EF1D